MMRRLHERFPGVELEIEDLEGEQGLDAVRLGHVDLAPAVRAALDALVEATVQLR